ncbi:MAG: MFS transporter [Syntrophobacteraceae bacterium]|jgi:MFS family permease
MQPENNPDPPYRTLILVSCVVGLGCYTAAYMRIPVLPLFARSLGAATVEIGLINSSFMLAAGVFAMPLGIVSDRLGRKPVAMAGLLVSALSSFLLAFSRTPAQMMAIYVLAGIGIAAFGPTMMSFVADFSPATHLGRSYGWYTMAMYGGMSLGPAIGGIFAYLLGYERVFTISAILSLIMLSIVLLTFPGQKSLRSSSLQKRGSGKKIKALLKNRLLLACWLVTLFSCFGLGVFITFLPLHASDHGIGAGEIGLIFAAHALVNALGRIPFGYLSDWISDRSILVLTGLLGYSISIAGTGFSTSPAMFFASAFAMGISMGVAFTAIGAMISEMVPADFRGLAMGGYNTCIYIGMMLSGLIMGVVAHSFGFRTCFLITACVNAAGAIAFILIFKSVSVSRKVIAENL